MMSQISKMANFFRIKNVLRAPMDPCCILGTEPPLQITLSARVSDMTVISLNAHRSSCFHLFHIPFLNTGCKENIARWEGWQIFLGRGRSSSTHVHVQLIILLSLWFFQAKKVHFTNKNRTIWFLLSFYRYHFIKLVWPPCGLGSADNVTLSSCVVRSDPVILPGSGSGQYQTGSATLVVCTAREHGRNTDSLFGLPR